MNTLLRAALGGALLSASLSHAAVAPVEDATPTLSRPAPKAAKPAVVDGVPYQPPELVLETPEAPAAASPGVVFEQLQALQAEVMMLRGLVETQAKALERLEAAQRDRYIDLDRRVARLSGLAPATPAAPSAPVVETPSTSAPVASNEREAYEAAFALTRDKRFAEAIPAFKAFIEAYPAGTYIPNAWYWLGDLHSPLSTPDPEPQGRPSCRSFPCGPSIPRSLTRFTSLAWSTISSALRVTPRATSSACSRSIPTALQRA